MRLKEIYQANKPVISFEIFPPKGAVEEKKARIEALFSELKQLTEFNPSFISVTYGAGGSTRDRTLEIVFKIRDELGIQPLPHYTCVGSDKSEILKYLETLYKGDIENILALRGDPPKGEATFIKPENGFGYANELVDYIKSSFDIGIAVAGYPEGHPECHSKEQDILNLKKKVDSGADIIVTQLFFDNKMFFDFLEKASNAGINIPIIPGILPITNYDQIDKMASMCSCTIPESLRKKLERHGDDAESVRQAGIEFASQQCRELIDNEIKGLHFYTLNKAFAVSEILKNISLTLNKQR